ncbi:MAG: polysaccharide deacetylase family protein [Caulobacteraceae bacterium]
MGRLSTALAWVLSVAAGAACAAPALAQQIAFTFDDLPAHAALPVGQTRLEIADSLIASLKAAGLPPVYGFVNGVREVEEPASRSVLPAWRAAGFPLGDHTWSHMNLNTHTLAEFEADVMKNRPVLEREMAGQDWRWFRFPNLAEGDTPEKRAGVRAFLHQQGYRVAQVTMSFGDYAFNDPYARCVAKADQAAIAQLERDYLKSAEGTIGYARALSKAVYGRDIPYVLLMHAGALDARMLPRLLARYKAHGFGFVTLPEAERDPAYRIDLDLALPPGPDTLEAAAKAKGLPLPPNPRDAILAGLDKVCR